MPRDSVHRAESLCCVQAAGVAGSSQLMTQIKSSMASAVEQRGAFPRPASHGSDQGAAAIQLTAWSAEHQSLHVEQLALRM